MAIPDELPAALRDVGLRPLFAMTVTVPTVHAPGGPAGAERRIGDISGGGFRGERLSGAVLPGGTDWQTLRSDGAVLLDARVVLRTDDGASIAMSYTGIRHGPAEVMARLGRGEDIDPTTYYFRIAPVFATSASRYEWLNRIVAIGVGHRLAHGPIYNIFEIL
ncbi:DUF3237 domain-containing protein [Edaphosphingomonas haloaromaticamans]|uniref:UPF0311 protein BHE75_01122 n=1 Tax=Edaphosphingomonas haloaromaticamans TaxID=653954 RepID=A0A1S1HAA4_9SPHN|nr:DUF3237 domain-containing protein [Sphingomonas haloaromaticamans]OHT19139.1 hypothetical protein BHE75_01122 [Sphingomonas haloaromaticamans]